MDSRLEKAFDPSYWREINPQLPLDEVTPGGIAALALDPEPRAEMLRRLQQEGYFQTEPLLSPQIVTSLKDCVEVLRREGWPAVFAFVYDAFWQIVRTPAVVQLLGDRLGSDYAQNSRIWCFHIPPVSGARGFPPHMDGFDRPNRITIWIPLSDATIENGCMYVIPYPLVPATIGDFARLTSVSSLEMRRLLQGARALPARAGSILGWHADLIHWGSTCSRPQHPRISISVEFLSKQETPQPDEVPMLDGHSLPSFHSRLHAIGKGILDYEHLDRGLVRYLELGRTLAQRAGK